VKPVPKFNVPENTHVVLPLTRQQVELLERGLGALLNEFSHDLTPKQVEMADSLRLRFQDILWFR
jgi:hypothetical protein